MSKEMTPMKRLNTGINQFRVNMRRFFREVDLNKSQPKHNPYAWRDESKFYSKGVKNDFTMIFSSNDISLTFALSFSYMDLPLEKQTVVASLKDTNSLTIVGSEVMSIEDFKAKLNKFNKYFSDEKLINMNQFKILEKTSEVFLSKSIDLKSAIKEMNKKIEDIKKQQRELYGIDELELELVNAEKLYIKTDKKVKKLIEDSLEKLEVLKLESLLIEANKNFNNKKLSIEKQYKLKELEDNKDSAKENWTVAFNKIANKVTMETKKISTLKLKK